MSKYDVKCLAYISFYTLLIALSFVSLYHSYPLAEGEPGKYYTISLRTDKVCQMLKAQSPCKDDSVCQFDIDNNCEEILDNWVEEVNEVCWVYITFYYSCLNVYPECKTEEKLVVDCVKKVDCRKWIDPEIVLGLNNKKMLQNLVRRGSKWHMHRFYDYSRIDPDSPRQIRDDTIVGNDDQIKITSQSFYALMYIFGGYAVYFATRIMYDFEWDRYYHVNYPAIMEYFDVITNYYIKKVRKIHQNLPDTLEVYIPEYNLTPTFIRTKDLSKIENKKLGAQLTEVIMKQQQANNEQNNQQVVEIQERYKELTKDS